MVASRGVLWAPLSMFCGGMEEHWSLGWLVGEGWVAGGGKSVFNIKILTDGENRRARIVLGTASCPNVKCPCSVLFCFSF